MQLIKTFIFGQRVKGEKVKEPVIRTTEPKGGKGDFNTVFLKNILELKRSQN